jgi:hypothetical protein
MADLVVGMWKGITALELTSDFVIELDVKHLLEILF